MDTKEKIDFITLDDYKVGPRQIEGSYEFLEKTRLDNWNKIIQTRKSTQDVENKRNIENQLKQNERIELLSRLEEVIDNEFIEVERKASSLMHIEQADELHIQFNDLKIMCYDILQRKKDLILEYSKQLDYKDQLYVDSLKKFRVDIQTMIKLMRTQFLTLRDQMLNHLGIVENKYKEDRAKLIEDYKNEVSNLISKLNGVERDKENQLRNLEKDLEKKAEKDAAKTEMEYINKIILLEKHANFLKESIEDFTYEIKILVERLDYRVEVREGKLLENQKKKDLFKVKEKELRNKRLEALKIYTKQDLENRVKNLQLKEELKKMTEAYDKLKDKFQHFEKYDDIKFKDVFNMKKSETWELALKVALAERTINTQQLGMDIINNDNKDGFTLKELQRKDDLFDEDNFDEKQEKNEEENNFRQNILTKVPTERVKQVFSYIMEEAEFLIETSVREACQGLLYEEKLPVYFEAICKALYINDERELNQLLHLFDKNNLADKEDLKFVIDESMNDSEDDADDLNKSKKGSKLEIDPDNVLRLLKDFYEEKKKKNRELMKASATNNAINKGEVNVEARKELIKYQSETFWIKLSKVITEKTYNVWKALETGLTNYHDLLFERKKLVEEVKSDQEKNKELKKLLTQYMQSDDNRALKVPPYQTIKKGELNFALTDLEN